LRGIFDQDVIGAEVSLTLRSGGEFSGFIPAADFNELWPKIEAIWRAEFESRGRHTIRNAIYSGQGIYPDRKRDLALAWLHEKETADKKRSDDIHRYFTWTLYAVIVTLVPTLFGLPIEQINTIWQWSKAATAW